MVLIGTLYAPFHSRKAKSPFHSSAAQASYWLAGVFMALVLVSYGLAPDWMWMYFIDHHSVSVFAVGYVLLMLYILPLVVGIVLGQILYQAGKTWWRVSVIVCVGIEAALLAGLWRRYNTVATSGEYITGRGETLLGGTGTLAVVMNIGGVVCALTAVYWWRRLAKSR